MAQNQYQQLFERSADAILIIDGETFVDCNEATVRMLGYQNKEELLQTHPSELSPPRQPDGRRSFEKASEMIAIAMKQGSHRFEWDHQRADGEVFPVEVLLTPVPDGDRTLIHVVWREIAERKDLERRLRYAQKMEAIGKLAGGVAHDFNNILVSILGYADLLARQLANSPKLLEQVQAIRSGGEQAAALISHLRAFGGNQDLKPQVLELDRIVDDLGVMIRRLIGEHIRIVINHGPETVPVKVDRGQMEQMILNLVTNARDAMPVGGTLTISVCRVRIEADSELELDEGEYASLRVEDSGCGMTPDVASSAFEPFFTTRHEIHATGLGLSSVYGMVKQSGGDLRMTTVPGEGTALELLLPECTELAAEDELLPDRKTRAPGAGTVLVVEDEPAVAGLVKQALESEGYQVMEARNGAAALRLFRKDGGDVDLILTDVVMPIMSGPELVAQILDNRPDLPALFMSGYTDDILTRHGFSIADVHLLRKPFSSAQLVDKVRQAI
jgi:PAS domain S-box-containing protein